jgi:TRAP transporter 4TM/12TM fusion protein
MSNEKQRGWVKAAVFALLVVSITMAVYHLVYTQVILQGGLGHRITHLNFALVVVSLSLLLKAKEPWFAAVLLAAAVVVAGYTTLNFDALQLRTGFPTTTDMAVGVMALLLVTVLTWIVFGKVMPVVFAVMVAYMFVGPHLSAPFDTPQVTLSRAISWTASVGVEWGVFGSVVSISANYLFLFVLFGSLLMLFGATRFIRGVGALVGQRMRSGPAGVAVFTSALIGMITGSTVANIMIVGSFTIPLMKKAGYSPRYAAGIEAASSNGGQIMPPVMGTVAFIMSGVTGIPYSTIALSAIIPAVLYFGIVLLYAELTARKLNIIAPPIKVEPREILLDAPNFVIPFGVLVWLLSRGYSLMFVAFWTIVALAALGLMRKRTRPSLRRIIDGFSDGAKGGAEIAITFSMLSAVTTLISVTGLDMKFPLLVDMISGGRIVIYLLATAVACLIVGCGVPTAGAYLLVVTIAVPGLLRLGLPIYQAHYFVMIYAVYSHLTPPVAMGSLVASKIAEADFWETSVEALKASFTNLLLPFMLVWVPIILLRPGDLGPALLGLLASVLCLLALEVGFSNYLFTTLNLVQRGLFLLGGAIAFGYIFNSSFIVLGAALCLVAFATTWQVRERRVAAVRVTEPAQ